MVSDRWELLVQKLSKRLDDGGFCACVCVCYTTTDRLAAFVWPSVPSCREITSNLCANQRISRRPDSRLPLLRFILGFFATLPSLSFSLSLFSFRFPLPLYV